MLKSHREADGSGTCASVRVIRVTSGCTMSLKTRPLEHISPTRHVLKIAQHLG